MILSRKRKRTEKDTPLLKLLDSITEISVYRFNKVVKGELEYLHKDNIFVKEAAEQYVKAFEKIQKEYLEYVEIDNEQEAITLAWKQWIISSCEYSEQQIQDFIDRMDGDIIIEDFQKKQNYLDAEAKLTEVGALKTNIGEQDVRFARVVSAVESFKGFRLDLQDVTVEFWITYLNEYRNYVKRQKEEN